MYRNSTEGYSFRYQLTTFMAKFEPNLTFRLLNLRCRNSTEGYSSWNQFTHLNLTFRLPKNEVFK